MQGQRSFFTLYLIFLFIFFITLPDIAKSDNNSEAKQDTIKSASELDYPPFSIVRSDGTADGFSVELLRAAVKAIGKDISFFVGPWNEIKQQLIDGHLDVLPLVSYSDERDKVLDFSIPYLHVHGAIFVRKGEKSIRSEADLTDKEVLVMRGDTAHEYAISKNVSNKLILKDSFEEAMRDLSAGKHDAVIIQQLVGFQLIKKLNISNVVAVESFDKTSLKPVTRLSIGFEQKFCFAVPEGNKELLSLLNEGLSLIIADGTFDDLYYKWFGPILPQSSIALAIVVKYILFFMVPILFFFLIFGIWYLKSEITRKTNYLKDEISEHKKTEEKLRDSEKKSLAWLESSPVCTKMVDLDFNLQYMSAAGINGLNIDDVTEFYGKPYPFDFYPESFRNLMTRNLEKVKETGKVIEQEGSVVDLNGNELWFHSTLVPVNDDEGQIDYFVVVSADITKRKQAEEKLRNSIVDLNESVKVGRVGLWNWDLITNEVNFSAEWKRQIGYEDHEICNKFSEWEDHVHPEDLKPTLKIIKKSIKDVNQNHHSEFRFRHKDGSYRWIYAQASLVLNEEGHPIRMVGSHLDITEQKRAAEEKKKLESRLLQAQKMESIGNLAGGIAHDFNNILYPIIGFAEILKQDLTPGSLEYESVQEIFNAGNRGGELVKQILAFSRQSEQKLRPVQIQKILKEVLKLTRSSIPIDIEIHQDVQEDCGFVLAEPTQLYQIAMNLITNAYHAVENANGKISVQLKEIMLDDGEIKNSPLQSGQHVMLSVSDNGIGIPRDIMDKIFEPYFTTKEKKKGTGLGLAVVYGIVKEHKGDIKVYSEEGEGTTFNVYLPLMKKSIEATSDVQVSELETGTERILLVDDEKSIVRLEKIMLKRLGYNVVAHSSSLEALETFKTNPDDYDLVITDMTMPNITGDQLAKKMISIRPNIPILICTGFSERISKEQAETAGVKGFLMKPIVKSELAKTVREILDEAMDTI